MELVSDYVLREKSDLGLYLTAPFNVDQEAVVYYKANEEPKITAAEKADEDKKKLYHKEVDRYLATIAKLKAQAVSVFTIVESNCSEAVMGILRSKESYIKKKMKGELLWLITQLKEITSGLDVTENKYAVFYDALTSFINLHQFRSESDDAFMIRFRNSFETLWAHGGRHVFASPQIVSKSTLSDAEIEKAEECFKAVALVKKLNRSPKKYGALADMLRIKTTLGRDPYPSTMPEAQAMMVHHSGSLTQGFGSNHGTDQNGADRARNQTGNRNGGVGHMFAQRGGNNNEIVPGADGTVREDVQCYMSCLWAHPS